MNRPIDKVGWCIMGDDYPTREESLAAKAAWTRIVYALHNLTAEHGTQCQCPGCEVLREGT